MASNESQNAQILSHLRNGRKITARSADMLFGCMRLAARIKDLRSHGHHIHTEMVKDEKTGKRFAMYSLIRNKESDHEKQKI